MRVIVLTKWNEEFGSRAAEVTLRYPGEWTDITGQNDAQLPVETDTVVFEGFVDSATLTSMETDSDMVVLSADEVDENKIVIPGGTKPVTANPTAQQRTALNTWLNAQGVTGIDRAALVRAGVSRQTIIDDIRSWAKERPKKTGG